ncbi:TPA: glycosyltransferase family 2 protein [Candidatus Woesearchaeota archaeon]|nr:glycosyltransferase family 2 protein [Candidatus Woesearchaeota archaeon]
MKVIITIPAYNEERTLPFVLQEIKDIMGKTTHQYQILVVDDGSRDKTIAIAKQHGAIVYSNPHNKGLAETFKVEMSLCLANKADIIVHTDADGQYPAKYIPLLIKEIENGADLVLGSRFGKGNYAGSIMKHAGNVAFAKAIASLTKVKVSDTTTGFRAFTRTVAEIPLINNFTYTQEQIIKAAKQGLKIREVPINARRTRDSRLFKSSLQYALKAWINIMRIYRDYDPLKFFGRIGTFFLCLGFLMGLWVLYSIMTTGGVGGIPRVILSAVLILTGLQIILFGFLADMFRR